MNKLQQRRLEVLEDTVKYYSKDVKRRSVNSFGCYYNGREVPNCTGTGCAVGRLVPLKIRKTLGRVMVESIMDRLPKSVRDLGEKFLSDLQSLHDCDAYWDDEGLSKHGEFAVELIKQNHINN